MSLLSLQAAFQDYLLGGDAPTDAVEGDAHRRLGVYHHAYRSRLGEVLGEVYDKTWAYVGDAAFGEAVARYVAANPSTSRSLDDYGAGFSELWPHEPDVAELAWLEWALRRAFDGPDASCIDPRRLASMTADDWDKARLTLHPTLTVRPARTNVGALWSALEAGSPDAPAPLATPMAVRVWRRDLQPSFRMIEPAERDALQRLSDGATFAYVCHVMAAGPGLDSLAAMLAAWLADGLVTDVIVD